MLNMQQTKASLVSVLAVTVFLPVAAAAQEACKPYTVQAGDSLGSIAQAAYGSFDYQMIFNANRNVIASPNKLEPGIELLLPCEDGQLSEDSEVADIITAEDEKQSKKAKSNVYEPPIKLVSGSGWAPFTGLRGGRLKHPIATPSCAAWSPRAWRSPG